MLKRLLAGIAISVACVIPAQAEEYMVTVTRLDMNVYKAQEGVIIFTDMCLNLAMGSRAVLIFENPYSFDNKIIFVDDRDSCRVTKVVSSN